MGRHRQRHGDLPACPRHPTPLAPALPSGVCTPAPFPPPSNAVPKSPGEGALCGPVQRSPPLTLLDPSLQRALLPDVGPDRAFYTAPLGRKPPEDEDFASLTESRPMHQRCLAYN